MARLSAPSFLLPGESPDSIWHLFCHSRLGVMHRKSTSGLAWDKGRLVHRNGRSPSILREGSTYHMVYSKDGRKGSSIFLSSSVDLDGWSKGHEIFSSSSVPFSSWRGGEAYLGYPQLVEWDGKYRLYFGAGRSEHGGLPARSGVAESDYLEGPYSLLDTILFSPQPGGSPAVLASGPLRLLGCSDMLSAIQAAVCYDEVKGRVYSSLFLCFSRDGLVWERGGKMMESRLSGWDSGLITGADLRWKENERTWYCFYSSARGDNSPWPSSMGLLLGQRGKAIP